MEYNRYCRWECLNANSILFCINTVEYHIILHYLILNFVQWNLYCSISWTAVDAENVHLLISNRDFFRCKILNLMGGCKYGTVFCVNTLSQFVFSIYMTYDYMYTYMLYSSTYTHFYTYCIFAHIQIEDIADLLSLSLFVL